MSNKPPCFNSEEQFEEYMRRLMRSPEVQAEHRTFCYDCLPDHQYDMMKENRCNHPETKFVLLDVLEEESIQGVRS